ncbi:MAG: hypothetical protein EOO20_19575 [Chryseobacterium sp.]|nr:MAG: hypothetical protein EOO20_19575 [Chryseobacterium sp.]
MKPSKIITVDDITADLSKIKAIRMITKPNAGNKACLLIELDSSFDFVLNPETGKYTPIRVDDSIEMLYANYRTAIDNMETWQAKWREYKNSKR